MYHFNGTDLYKIEQWQNGFKTSDKSISESDVGVMTRTTFLGPDDLRKIWKSKTKSSNQ